MTDIKEKYSEQDAGVVHVDDIHGAGNIAEHVSYGHSGVRGIFESPYVFFAALLISFGGFSWGYGRFRLLPSSVQV